MAVTIGTVEERVVLRGDHNVAEARAIGEESGAAMGDGWDKAWTDKLKRISDKTKVNFRKTGELSSVEFLKSWEKDSGGFKKVASDIDRISDAVKRNRVQVQNHGASLKRWQAITLAVTALILGAGNDIAALGSALGAGITVLASGVASLAVAGAVAIPIFKELGEDIDTLPDDTKEAARQFQELGKTFKQLQRDLTSAFASRVGDAFSKIGKTVKALTPDLQEVAKTWGDLTKSFADGIQPGTRAFTNFQKVIKNANTTLKESGRVVGTWGQAILQALGSPRLQQSVNKLLAWLDQIGKAFDKFVSGKGFDKWLDNADSVFGSVGKLLDSLGKTLNNLSTDDAVKSLNNLLDAVSRFLPKAGELIEIGGKLDPLGLVAQALDDIGEAIQPLIKPLGDLADAIHRVASIMLKEWKGAFGDISDAIAPLVQDVADFLNGLDEDDINHIADALLALAAAFVVVKGAQGIAGLSKKIGALSASITDLSGKQATIRGIGVGLVAALTTGIQASGEDAKGDKNPLLTVVGNIVNGAVTGLALGGPIGLAVGTIAAIITSWLFAPDTMIAAQNQANTWLENVIVIPIATVGVKVGNAINGLWNTVILAFAVGGINAQNSWNSFWGGITDTETTFIASVIANFQGFIAQLVAGFLTLTSQGVANWNNFWGTIYNTMLTWLAKIIVGAQQLPGQISTAIQTGLNGLSGWWNGFWSGLWSNVSSWWSQIISTVSYYANQVISIVNGALGAISKLSGGLINLHIPKLPTTATGGIFAGAQTRVIGEAGPEAVVPLARDLSRVDPAVRALSAFAQGKLTGQQQTGPQKVITVAEGAVQVQYQGVDPRIVGTSAIDRLVARFATA